MKGGTGKEEEKNYHHTMPCLYSQAETVVGQELPEEWTRLVDRRGPGGVHGIEAGQPAHPHSPHLAPALWWGREEGGGSRPVLPRREVVFLSYSCCAYSGSRLLARPQSRDGEGEERRDPIVPDHSSVGEGLHLASGLGLFLVVWPWPFVGAWCLWELLWVGRRGEALFFPTGPSPGQAVSQGWGGAGGLGVVPCFGLEEERRAVALTCAPGPCP